MEQELPKSNTTDAQTMNEFLHSILQNINEFNKKKRSFVVSV